MPATQTVDPLAPFRVSAKRAPIYTHAEKAPRAAVVAISDSAYVTRGTHAKNATPVLLVQDGSSQHALPLSAIGAAIAGNVITKAEIEALLA